MPCRFFVLLAALLVLVLPASSRAQTDAPAARPYYSIDYSVHDTFGGAIKNSFAPTSFRDNVGASLSNTLQPLNPVRYVGAIVALEVQKEIASGNGIDVGKVIRKLDPASLAGGYLGAQAGEIVGAAAQTALSCAVGPIGGTLGFALRPILWLAGSSIGGEVGRSIAHGDQGGTGNPFKDGIAKALREFNPVQDSVQMIGDNVGGVIGQALIPVPFVGFLAGATVGGVTGLLLGKAVTATGPGQALDSYLRRVFKAKADRLAPERMMEAGDAPPAVPRISGATAAPAAPMNTTSKAAADRAYSALQDALKRNDRASAKQHLDEYQRALSGK